MTMGRSGFASQLLAVGGIALGIAASGAGAQGLNASIGEVPVASDAEAMRALSEKAQLAKAFEAAFGGGKERVHLDGVRTMVYEPGALAWTSSGAVLVSTGTVEDAGPADFGVLAIHYLKPEGTSFKVTGAYPKGIESSLAGDPPQWVVSTDFGDNPVVVTDTLGSRQGITCTITALYELGGSEPASLGAFQSGYDNIGAAGEAPGARTVSITGSIRNIAKGKSFEMHFDGSSSFRQLFTRRGAKYVKTGGDGQLPDC